MASYSALTTLRGKDAADRLAAALETLEPAPTGVGVFELEDGSGLWEVGAYFLDRPQEVALSLLSAAFAAAEFAISEIPETDWVAAVRRELAPVEAGRFFVYGAHDAGKVPAGAQPLLIEAAMAFGTGHHGTTLGCLRAFDRLLSAGNRYDKVADIGCGTAVLAMAAAREFGGPVWASDIDAVAVEVASANAKANDLEGQIITVEAAGFDHPVLAEAAPFDLIFANILKGPLITLAPDVAAHAAPGGHVILSGLLNTQADEVIAHYARVGFNLVHHDMIVDWSTLTLLKNA